MRRERGVTVQVTARIAALAALLLAALPAGAQDVTGNEEHLVDLHALLLDLPAIDAPGAFRSGELNLALEVTDIPVIDGDVGPKTELTASDHARAYPRFRLALGLPAPSGFRAFVGAAYVPPVEINRVTVNSPAVEAGFAWVNGPLRIGLQGHGVWARVLSPVSSPDVRDELTVTEGGWDLRAGYEFRMKRLAITPYAGAGQVYSSGHFRSSVDGGIVDSTHSGAAYSAGARLLYRDHWEGVVEYSVYPGMLWNPRFRFGYVMNLGW